MASRLTPYHIGEVVTLRGPRDGNLKVHAPDGLEVTIPAANGKATVWLPQTGTWRYRWSDGSGGELAVIDAPNDDAAPEGAGVVEPG